LSTKTKSDQIDDAFEKAALSIVGEHVPKECILGLGSGSAVARFARVLGERNRSEPLKVRVVPSSTQAWLLARQNGLPFYEDSAHCPQSIDVVVDGADQMATLSRSMIKGGGGALFREKIMLSSPKSAYILGDENKFVPLLTRSVPVEVSQFAILGVGDRIRKELRAEPTLRKLDKGYPYFTESGNLILDCLFEKPLSDPQETERALKTIPGVIEAGIFTCRVDAFYKANHDGTFESF
jgi:ribose 5-phosphate isomerase A